YISNNIFSNYNSEETLDLADHKVSMRGPQTRGQSERRPINTSEDHVRFFVNLGKNDGVNIQSFLENIAGSASVKRKELKNVVLKDDFSFLEVHKSHKNRFLKGKKLFFKKKALRFEVARTPGKR
ncbi:MAG: DbpA RNA binding domain-containing protein, partial [Bdellovibrionota bacterium]|nr:DbpA RNA binding domain-containing protein [Bdellovibrionota bacterium]